MSEPFTRYVTVYTVAPEGSEDGSLSPSPVIGYWTGVPSNPWTLDAHRAHMYDSLNDAHAMSRLLASGAAVTGPHHLKTAQFRAATLTFQLVDTKAPQAAPAACKTTAR